MRNKVFSPLFISAILLISFIIACVHARPNPVPNDELDPEKEMEKYEKNHEKEGNRVKRHRRLMGSEDPDDQDVLDELKGIKFFKGIRRRNRDVHPHKRSVFQKFIDDHMFSTDDESKEH